MREIICLPPPPSSRARYFQTLSREHVNGTIELEVEHDLEVWVWAGKAMHAREQGNVFFFVHFG